MEELENIISNVELGVLSSIIRIGNAVYKELLLQQEHIFFHPYLAGIKGRLRTKLVQMQAEIESHNPNFPFTFVHRHLPFGLCIPELHTKNIVLHIAQSSSPDKLPSRSQYKVNLSYNNCSITRQLVFDTDNTPPIGMEPVYGLLVFGEDKNFFAAIQFPSPGYEGITGKIKIPIIVSNEIQETEETKEIERKTAKLKKEFLQHGVENISNG